MAGRSLCLRLLSKDVEKDKDGEKTFAEEEMAAEEEKGTDRAASDAAKPAAEATEGADRAEKAQGAGPGVVTATGEAQTETETKTVAEKPKASQEEEKAQESSKETGSSLSAAAAPSPSPRTQQVPQQAAPHQQHLQPVPRVHVREEDQEKPDDLAERSSATQSTPQQSGQETTHGASQVKPSKTATQSLSATPNASQAVVPPGRSHHSASLVGIPSFPKANPSAGDAEVKGKEFSSFGGPASTAAEPSLKKRRVDPVLAAQDDELEQRVTREVIGVLQETGSLEANDLVDLCEKIGCSHNVMARVVRMLVATPLVNELVLLGDVMRGDRRFIFRHGMGLGRRIDLATIDKQIAALEKDVKLAEQRAERISSLGKDPALSSETLDKILVGQPETVKQLSVYTRLLRETSPPTSSS